MPPKSGSGSIRSNGGGGSDSGTKKPLLKVAATGGTAQVKARYGAQLPSLSLWYGEKSWSILEGEILPTLHNHVICKNWHLCGVCW